MTDYFEGELLEIIDTFKPEKRSEALDRFIECVDESAELYLKASPSIGDAFEAALDQREEYDPREDVRIRANAMVDEFVLRQLKYKTYQ
jgi:hypothetical protein